MAVYFKIIASKRDLASIIVNYLTLKIKYRGKEDSMAGFVISNTISNIIVCGLWTYISAMFAGPLIATWVGFAGCTSYYTA